MTPIPVTPFLKVKGNQIVTDDSQETPVLLRGAGLGGWMNMENVSFLAYRFSLPSFTCHSESPVAYRVDSVSGSLSQVIQVTNVGLFPILLPPPVPFFPTQQRITSTYDPALTFIG
jgi:hypothetical protein